MSSKLIFHIGGFKSGSTAIQSTLARKAYSCDSRQILYPGLAPREGLEKTQGQHGPLADTLFPGKTTPARQRTRFSQIARNIAAGNADLNVISAEKFEYANPRLLAEAIEQYFPAFRDDLQVIVYVRPHAERVLAEFAERVKHGTFRDGMEDLHARTKPLSGPMQRGFFYHPRLSLWRRVFGDRLTVRPMIRAYLEQSDVVADFFRQILGPDVAFALTEAPQKNASPSLEDLAALRALHRACGEGELSAQQERAGVLLAQLFAEDPAGAVTRLALHRSLAQDIAETYAEDAAALDRDFFTGTPMQEALAQAPTKAVEQPQSLDVADLLDAGQLRQVTAWSRILARMITDRRPN